LAWNTHLGNVARIAAVDWIMPQEQPPSYVANYPLLDALRNRRSRRFGVGMEMKAGPLAFRSTAPPLRLGEDEEALLAFAACGVTGPALGDLVYSEGGGGTILAGMHGRTVASGDAIQTVSVFVINEDSTYLLKRSRDFAPPELAEAAELSRNGRFTELYRKSRVLIRKGRAAPPLDPFYNLNVNRWSLYDPASTYFLPVNELTLLYINGVLEILSKQNCSFIVDERAGFQPAGLKRFAKSRGGWLLDDPKAQRSLTIQQLETLVTEFVTIEQGMVMQNLGLMTQALGLGGFPHWAAHPWGWLEALGFRMQPMAGTAYLGAGRLLGALARLLGKDAEVRLGLGLEVDGAPVLVPFCPPFQPSMAAAVRAVVELKYGAAGVFGGGAAQGAWREPGRIAEAAERPSDGAIDATIAFCEYVYRRYGRFPAYQPPFRTVVGFQASHVDTEFYDRFYKSEALSQTQRRHMETWHSA
jgi:hypothetical protein